MGKKMTFFVFLGLIVAFSLLPASAKATTMVYTDEASFKGVLQPGYYLQEFSGVVDTMPHSLSYVAPNGSGYSYTVSTDSVYTNLYWIPTGLSMAQWGSSIVITFTGAPVTAVGGNFWLTDQDYANVTGNSITITLSDGTTRTIAVNSPTFIGFATADGPAFTSLSIKETTPRMGQYPTLNHLYVGADPPPPVPEASGLVLLGSGLVGLGFYARKRRRKQ